VPLEIGASDSRQLHRHDLSFKGAQVKPCVLWQSRPAVHQQQRRGSPFTSGIASRSRTGRARRARDSPAAPWPVPWSAIGRRCRLRRIKLACLVTPIRTASDVTTLNDAASWSGYLLIGIIDHDHNSALDLFRRAVRWRAHPPGLRVHGPHRAVGNSCHSKPSHQRHTLPTLRQTAQRYRADTCRGDPPCSNPDGDDRCSRHEGLELVLTSGGHSQIPLPALRKLLAGMAPPLTRWAAASRRTTPRARSPPCEPMPPDPP
jgi:hypothetical protein